MTTAVDNQPSDPSPTRRKTLLWVFTIILLIIGGVLLFIWFTYWRYHQTTDDAYANGRLVHVNSVINGSVVAFYADDTDLVKEGQLLVELDSTYQKIAYEKALAALTLEVMRVNQLYDAMLVSQAAVEVKRIAASKARYDYQNRSQLVNTKAISEEEYTHSQDDLKVAETDLEKAELELRQAMDAVGITPVDEHPEIEMRKAAIREAYYELKHTRIFAPATGYVAQRSVNVGQAVTPTKNLMSIVPKDYFWVDANFKETQLTDMRIGQPATVWFDIYGSSITYEGKVLGIASGSGSVFSLIPPQNATGNWIKIVQRLPVRISLDPETMKAYPLRLGLSAEVDVDISNQDLPRLADVTHKFPVGKTSVYDIDMTEVNRLIDEIIKTQILR